MSLSLLITINVVLDVALLGFLAWMMSHPRHLTPHVSLNDSHPSRERGAIRFTASRLREYEIHEAPTPVAAVIETD